MTVVWGYGSIGRRHISNLLAITQPDLAAITRTPENVERQHAAHITTWTLDQVDWPSVEQIIIATPTAFHLEHLEYAITRGVRKILLEKPVSHSIEHVAALSTLIEKTSTSVYVGYDLRYDEGIKKVQQILAKGKLGRICSIHAHAGQFLPDWRPQTDYSRSMSASIAQGGGVMLDLAHEIDYLFFLFGEFSVVASLNQKRSDLEIETEDTCDSLFWFHAGFSGTLHLDYLQKPLRRFLIVVGDQGRLHLDLATKVIELVSHRKKLVERTQYGHQDRNTRFQEYLRDFTSTNPSQRLCDWQQGCSSQEIIAESKIATTYWQARLAESQ